MVVSDAEAGAEGGSDPEEVEEMPLLCLTLMCCCDTVDFDSVASLKVPSSLTSPSSSPSKGEPIPSADSIKSCSIRLSTRRMARRRCSTDRPEGVGDGGI